MGAQLVPQQQQQLRVGGQEMPPHEPSGLPGEAGKAVPPASLLKALQASSSVPPAEVAVHRQQNGAAPPAKAAAAGAGAPAAAANGAPASAPQQGLRGSQQTAVVTPAAQPTAATPLASPPAGTAAAAQPPQPAQPPPAADAAQQAAADLETILGRIMNLDLEGWFRHPVRDCDAPNYSKIIRRPMCFEVMRGKIRSRRYVNWNELVRDFELICSNAMKYNQKRSRVHKQALVMLRAGKKLLVELEAEGRRAVAALARAGPAAAAPAASQPAAADGSAVPSSLRGTPVTAPLRCASTADTVTTTEADSEAMQEDVGAAEPPEADPAGYSSYEATDLEDEDEEGDAAGGGGRQQAGADAAMRQRLLEYSRDAVLVQRWDGAGALQQPAADRQRVEQAAQQQQQQQQQQAGAGPSQAHSREWKAVRGGVEWRCRWLELRLVELARQRQRYASRLAAEAAREAAGGRGGAAPPPAQAAPLPRLQLPDLQLPGLLEHPFVAQHSGLRGGGALVAAAAAAAAATPAAAPAAMDGDDFPAEAHAALELLDQRLSSLRRQLVALQKPMGGSLLGRAAAVRVPGFRGRPRGGGGATPRGTPRAGSFSRDPSLAKRRRLQEYDMGELVTPLGAPKFVERAQVKTIDTPRVRTLPAAELKKRQAAVEALAAQLGKKGGAASAEGKVALEAIASLCPGEGSSDEDTSDEAYLSRHEAKEKEERARYEAVLGAAVNKNKMLGKVGKERTKHCTAPRPSVSRALSAPALVGGSGSAGLGTPAAPLAQGAAATPQSGPPTAPAPAAAAATPAAAPAASAKPPAAPGLSSAATAPAALAVGQQAASAAAAADRAAAGTPSTAAGPSSTGANGSAKPPATSAPGLTGPNGLPLVMIPMNAAMAAHMAQQMVAAAAAANASKAGGGGAAASAAAAAAAAAATSSAMLRPPFTLTPAMAAAMAAASGNPLAAAAQQAAMRQAHSAMAAAAAAAAAEQGNGLPPALQAIIPSSQPPANGSGGGGARRGRPARQPGRPRR